MYDLNKDLLLPRIFTVDPEAMPTHWASFFKTNRAKLHVVALYENDAGTGKLWPASKILSNGIARGDHGGSDTVIDSTSGGYGVALEVATTKCKARDETFPITRVVAVVSRSLPLGKRKRLLDFGIELIEADNAVDAMRVAEKVANERGYWYTKQYWNPDNSAGWHRVAGHIADELPMLGMAVWGVGSGGGASGIMPKLQEHFAGRSHGFHRVAVVVEDGQKIGGVRDETALDPGSLPWRDVDDVRFVGEDVSYRFSATLWRQRNNVCGPSTGFAAEGAGLAARRLVIMRKFDELRAPDGYVHIVIPSLDKRDLYPEEYRAKGLW